MAKKKETKKEELKTEEPKVVEKKKTEEPKVTEDSKPKEEDSKSKKEDSKSKIEVDPGVIESMRQEIQRLTAAADLNRLAKYDQEQANKNELIKKVKVSFIENKPVLARKTLQDEVFVDSRGVYHETQIMEVILEGGEKKEMNYTDYIKRREKRVCEVIGETKTSEGLTLKVRLSDGKELEIDDKFIN